jgi:hypothetical protein
VVLGIREAGERITWNLATLSAGNAHREAFAFEIGDLTQLWVTVHVRYDARNDRGGFEAMPVLAPILVPVQNVRASEEVVCGLVEARLGWFMG